MTVCEAAESLSRKLRNREWFVSVGVANQTLILYVKRRKSVADLMALRNGWGGFKVVRRIAGPVKPANT